MTPHSPGTRCPGCGNDVLRRTGFVHEFRQQLFTVLGGSRIGPGVMSMRTGGTGWSGLLETAVIHPWLPSHGPSASRWAVRQRGASSSGMSGEAKWNGTLRWLASAWPALAAAPPGGAPSGRW